MTVACLPKKMICCVAMSCVVLLLTGCGAPRVDATSEATLKTTLEKMTAGMSDDEKKAFGADCMTVAFFSGPDGGNFGKMLTQGMSAALKGDKSPKMDTPEIMKLLHGLTVAEIHAKAEEVRQRMKK